MMVEIGKFTESGAVEKVGEKVIPFSMCMKRELVLIQKIFKFGRVGNLLRISLPKEVIEALKVDEGTHYVVAFSEELESMVVLFFNFEELARAESDFVKKQGTIMKSIKMDGYLLSGVRKVWKSTHPSRSKQYGITVPKSVIKRLNLNQYTLFVMGYIPSKRALYFEFRSLFEPIMMERLPAREDGEAEITP